jgi:hypothetical protein
VAWTPPASLPPDNRTPEELRIAGERQRIREFVPHGWEDHHSLLAYGVTGPVGLRYGVCGHRRVCLAVAGEWKHPYPFSPPWCDDPPAMSHSGIWLADDLRSYRADPPVGDG